jgi:hypothetical protein
MRARTGHRRSGLRALLRRDERAKSPDGDLELVEAKVGHGGGRGHRRVHAVGGDVVAAEVRAARHG